MFTCLSTKFTYLTIRFDDSVTLRSTLRCSPGTNPVRDKVTQQEKESDVQHDEEMAMSWL